MSAPRCRKSSARQFGDQETGTPRPMHISLRAGERLFLNGAVLRADKKVTLELLNDATFLLENHVLQVEDTDTPLRQLYFAAQAMLMDPQNAAASRALFEAMASDLTRLLTSRSLLAGVREAQELVSGERPFQALKALRCLFAEEAALLGRPEPRPYAERRAKPARPPKSRPRDAAAEDEEAQKATPPQMSSRDAGEALPRAAMVAPNTGRPVGSRTLQ